MSDIDNVDDSEETDACGDEITEDEADDEETASLRPLFPDGNPNTEQAWRDLFSNPPQQGDTDE